MSVKLIETRLQEYNIANQRDELNALKEIMQEIALNRALARTKLTGYRPLAYRKPT